MAGLGMKGLGGYMPAAGGGLSDVLKGLNVELPAGLEGMMPKQLQQGLSIGRQFQDFNRQSPTASNYFQDPGKKFDTFMTIWKHMNSWIQSQGGQYLPVWDFAQQAEVDPEIQMMLNQVFPGAGGMGGGQAMGGPPMMPGQGQAG